MNEGKRGKERGEKMMGTDEEKREGKGGKREVSRRGRTIDKERVKRKKSIRNAK